MSMTAAILQTPLEVILFFSSLASHGVKPDSFAAISDKLKKDQHIRDSAEYDETRLSPESLQHLYLTLLKEEIRNRSPAHGQSPSQSQGEQEAASSASRKRKLSSPPLQSLGDAAEHEHLLPVLVNKLYARYREHAIASIRKEEDNYKRLQAQLVKLSQGDNQPHINGDRPQSVVSKTSQDDRDSNERLRDTTTTARSTPTPTPKEGTAATSGAASIAVAVPSAGPPSQNSTSSAVQRGETALSRPSVQAARDLPTSPHSQREKLEESASPVPAGVVPSRSSPSAATTFASATQDRPSTILSSLPRQGSTPSAEEALPSPLRSSTPTTDTRQQYGSQPLRQPFPHRALPSPQPGLVQQQLPPHIVQNIRPSLSSPGTPQQSAQWPQHSQIGNLNKPPAISTPSHSSTVLGRAGPFVTSSAARKVLPHIDTSASSTRWKNTGRTREKSPERPLLSPLRVELDDLGPDLDEDDFMTLSRASVDDSRRASPTDHEDTPSRPFGGRGRGRRGRGRGGRMHMARADSTSASARTRSQSVTSQTDEPSIGRRAARNIKPEPDTPAEDRPSSALSSNAGTPLPQAGRRRAPTLRTNETPPQIRPGQKRKRSHMPDISSPSSAGPGTPKVLAAPSKPGFVLAVRNLPRIAATILNDVTTHKLASMFQKPISEREAPGYRDLVYQPQDLKTIRSMLSAGQKVIITADSAAQESGVPLLQGPSAGTVWLERSADVLPPRAIVNSGQLETEICRIFANAVMFNPDRKRGIGPTFRTRARRAEAERRAKAEGQVEKDPSDEEVGDDDVDDQSGGVVDDAREMFFDVERQLASWRAAERTAGRAGPGETSTGGISKEESTAEESKDEDDVRTTRAR